MYIIIEYFHIYLALECYHENVYKGFRKQTESLHQCRSGTTCNFDLSKGKPGCHIEGTQEWNECSISKCGKDYDYFEKSSTIYTKVLRKNTLLTCYGFFSIRNRNGLHSCMTYI